MGTVRVSVVMASYNTGARIEWTLTELQRQSLDSSEFEIVVVDDGSTDDTFERLQKLADAYPNLVVDRIPNSGWPGRPRNVGVRRASGDYVFFMDHDDAMFPEALERLVAFADEAEADVVIPKEVVDGWKTPGWPTWRENVARVADWDADVVACITPHKLYRRQYLIDHDITFPEGRIRLEDFDFNAQAWVRTDKVAIFSEYPCYTWIIGDGNSHKSGYDVRVYWESFERSLQPIVNELPEGAKRDVLLVRWYRSRVLERLNPQMVNYSDSWRRTLARHFDHLLPYFPPSLDASLVPADRMRSALLRRGDWEALHRLATLDRELRPKPTATEASWQDGRLVITCRGHFEGKAGPFRVAHRDGRLHRVVPDDLGLSPGDTDLTSAVGAAKVDLIVRSRHDHVDWNLPTTAELTVSGDQGEGTLAFELRAELDPRTAAFGEPLAAGVWDLILRVSGMGWFPAVRLASPRQLSSAAVVGGRQAVLYTTLGNTLALDTVSEARTLLDHAHPSRRDLVVTSRDDEVALSWPLPNVHVPDHDHASLEGCVLVDDRRYPARVVTNTDGATLLAFVDLPGDDEVHSLRAQFGVRPSRPLAGLRRTPGVRVVGPPRPPAKVGPDGDSTPHQTDEHPVLAAATSTQRVVERASRTAKAALRRIHSRRPDRR